MTGQRPRDEPEDFGEGHPLEVVLHQLWTRREAEALRGGDVDPDQLDRNRHRAHGYEQAIAARHEARLKERGSAAGDHLPACLDRHHTSTQVRRLRTGEPGLQPSQPHLDLCRGAHAGVGGRPAWCGAGRVGEQDHGHPVRWDRRSHRRSASSRIAPRDVRRHVDPHAEGLGDHRREPPQRSGSQRREPGPRSPRIDPAADVDSRTAASTRHSFGNQRRHEPSGRRSGNIIGRPSSP
jgi:hypothetical protein